MDFQGFIGPAYDLRNFNYDAQTLKNWLIEVNESGKGKGAQPAQFIPRPGLTSVVTGLAGQSRGGFVTSAGRLYWVFGPTLYRITTVAGSTSGWSATVLGSVGGSTQPVQMTENGYQLFVLSNGVAYAYDFTAGTLSVLTGGAYASASTLTFMDNYIVYSKANTNQFFWTDLLTTTAPALNFASAEASPDRIIGLVNNNLDLWLFGQKTIEIWYNYGQNNVVFARRGNLLVETGCLAAQSITKINSTVMWLAGDDRGGAQVMLANGYTPIRVSTYPLEQQWQAMAPADLANATAYTMQFGGHQLYILDIPNAPETYVYDLTSSQQLGKPCWCVFTSSDGAGTISRFRGQGHAYVSGYHVTGDNVEGILYVFDENVYTDDGDYIVRERTSPHVSNEMKRVFYDNITIDFLTGITTDMTLDPQVMLQYSDDGGATWSDERWETCGMTGQYGLRVEFRRNGSGRNRVWRLRCTDAQYWALSGASIDTRLGVS